MRSLTSIEGTVFDHGHAISEREGINHGASNTTAGCGAATEQLIDTQRDQVLGKRCAEKGTGLLLGDAHFPGLGGDQVGNIIGLKMGVFRSFPPLVHSLVLHAPGVSIQKRMLLITCGVENGQTFSTRRLKNRDKPLHGLPAFRTAAIGKLKNRIQDFFRTVTYESKVDVDNEEGRPSLELSLASISGCSENLFIPFRQKGIPNSCHVVPRSLVVLIGRVNDLTRPFVEFRNPILP